MIYLAFCAAALIGEVTLIGRLTFADMLLAGAAPVLIVINKGVGRSPLIKQFYLFATLWFVGAALTDVVRATPLDDVFRGWSKIIFFILNFTSIWLLVDGRQNRIIAFIVLLLITSIVRLRVQPDTADLGADIFGMGWKFGYGQLLAGATLLVSAVLVARPVTRLVGVGLPFLDAIVDLVFNARNLFGLMALSALAFLLTVGRRRPVSPVHLAAICAAGVVVGWGSISVYSYAASEGLLGVEALEKYEQQSSGRFGVFLGGRQESLASTQAINDSPILGHGSWAKDYRYVELMLARAEQAGYEVQGDPYANDLIPTHSHLFGAWVEAGVLGAAFWVWTAAIAIRGLNAVLRRPTPLTGFVVFIGLSLLWDILFSPFGLERRVVTPAWIILMMLATENAGRENKALGSRV